MGHDDHDRNFEKALARHLRYLAASAPEAGTARGTSLQFCPDPEILAAYHEQSLSSRELSLWKSHVVSCSHCQFVLAQLAATENIALAVAPTEDALPLSAPPSSTKERPGDSRFASAERRPPSWRWVLLLPAGAIAASLVAWISLRNSIPSPVSNAPRIQTAENRPAPPLASQPIPALAAPNDRKDKFQAASPSRGAIGGILSPNRAANATQHDLELNQRSSNHLQVIPSHGPSASLQNQQQQQASQGDVSGSAGATPQKKLNAPAPAVASRNAKSPAVPASLPPPPPPEPFSLDGSAEASSSASKVSPRPPAPSSEVAIPKEIPKEKSAGADALSSAAESVEVSAEPQATRQAKAMLRSAALENPHVFVAPDHKHLWRVGPAGSLERSKDEGIRWTAQASGVSSDLTAGSAPSVSVVWIVGASGTILRTTDAGMHWTKLNSPVRNDLTGVRATDASNATIWFVTDRETGALKTYETTDGGASWSPNPPK